MPTATSSASAPPSTREAWWGFEAEPAKAGALITSIEEGSPADKAGLRRDDVVVRLEGSPVRDADELRFLLRDIPLGTRVGLEVARGKQKVELTISAVPLTPEKASHAFEVRTGLKLVELSVSEARDAGYQTRRPVLAVKSVERGSLGERSGIRRGDLVLALNSAEVDTFKEFRKSLAQARKSGQAVVLVQRGNRLQEFTFDLG